MKRTARPGSRGRALLAVLFVLTLPLVTPKIRAGDEIQYFSYLHSAWFDHDLEFGDEYQHFYDRDPKGLAMFKGTFLDKREPLTGRHLNFAPIGTALLWSPFYLLAHGGVLAGRALGLNLVADGFSRPYEASACYASALYGFLALLLVHASLVEFGGFPERASTWATGAIWLGTPLLYYMTLAPGFAHSVGFFTVALLLWLWMRSRAADGPKLNDLLLMGVVGGLAALVREQIGLFLAVPAADVALRALARRDVLRGLLRLLALGATAALVFAPQLLAYHAVNGHYGPSHLVTRKMTYSSPHLLGVLFDPSHGLFLWTPLLLLATAGLLLALVRRRDAATALLALGLLLQLWINGSIESWTQAGAFGARRFVDSTPVFAWGLAALLAAGVPRLGRLGVATLLAVLVWWNISLMIQFGLKLMDRQGLEWPRVAINQVREVPPRLGHVILLFLTDRERLLREGP